MENSQSAARLILELLSKPPSPQFALDRVDGLPLALARLKEGPVDVVLLNLALPGTRGHEAFTAIYDLAPDIPTIVLADKEDDVMAIRVVRDGAQDYLLKGAINGPGLWRAIRYAIERHGVRVNRVAEGTAALATVNRDLEAFTYSVSHDLRAPLRHVSSFVRILVDEFRDTLDPKAQHYLKRIEDGARRMSELVDDLLTLARVGKQDLQLRATPLAPIVERIIVALKTDISDRHIDWEVGKLPVVECDAGLMGIVLTNLLSNAVKYTRPRERARIEIGQTARDGEQVLFVRDNGVGFDMKYADKLFGVFQRLHRAEEFDGTGVGLATVQRIAQKHGWKIWAEAEVDQGATFFFTFGAPMIEPSTTRGKEVA